MTANLKAFCVDTGDFSSGCLLVYALKKNKAKAMCVGYFWEFEPYSILRARRVKCLDKYAPDKPTIYDNNKGLPESFFNNGDE